MVENPKIWSYTPKFSEKIRAFLIYFTFTTPYLTPTRLTKLMYISELYSLDLLGKRLTDANFFKYYYGPWSPDIDYTVTSIAGDEILIEEKETREGYPGSFYTPNIERGVIGVVGEASKIVKNVLIDWKYIPTKVLINLIKSSRYFKEIDFGEKIDLKKYVKEKKLTEVEEDKLKTKILGYDVILEKEEDNGYSIFCPELNGCWSCGDTLEEALENIKEAIIGYFETVTKYESKNPQSVCD